MGCGCGKGSGAQGSSTRIALTKRPGYTWNGPAVDDDDVEAAELDALSAVVSDLPLDEPES